MLTPSNKSETKMVMLEDNQPPSVGSMTPSVSTNRPLILPFVDRRCSVFCQKGLTLLELMTVLVIAGVLFGFAVPAVGTFIKNNRIVTQTNELMADLSFARSEAIKRSENITTCKLVADASSPTCNSTGNDWAGGWTTFIDSDSDGVIDTGEQVLRTRQSLTESGNTLVASNNLANRVIFSRTGLTTLAASGQWTLCDDRQGSLIGRRITLETVGRATIQKANCP